GRVRSNVGHRIAFRFGAPQYSRLPAQPRRIGPGVTHTQFQPTRRGQGEHERGGSLEFAAQHIRRAGRLEPQGPPGLASRVDIGKLHRTLWPRARSPATPPPRPPAPGPGRPPGNRNPADPAPLAPRPPARRVSTAQAGRAVRKRPLLPGLQAAAGTPRHLQEPGASPGTPSPPAPAPRAPSPKAP